MKLRDYAALGLGETIVIEYMKKDHYLTVLEIKPNIPQMKAISIIETDLIVDFAPAADAPPEEVRKVESKTEEPASAGQKLLTKGSHRLEADEQETSTFKPFAGNSYSLKSKPQATKHNSTKKEDSDSDSEEEENAKPKFVAFGGQGFSLKKK
eukprot:TRINITY_DN1468_c0_g1_i4.p1 TRINITY_DN1468_c0_g1~~TRINITY_DN1468_c0_g1_i4.p1  ORF type:complete len:153 (-),score=51.89 TRINITY_DN1468_c0_g1_i4:134-592(-)